MFIWSGSLTNRDASISCLCVIKEKKLFDFPSGDIDDKSSVVSSGTNGGREKNGITKKDHVCQVKKLKTIIIKFSYKEILQTRPG